MNRLMCVSVLLLAMTPLPIFAADGPAGSWKMKIPIQEGQYATFLFALSETDGKWIIDFIASNPRLPAEPKLKSVKLSGDQINFAFSLGNEEFLNFDGSIAKDRKSIQGSVSIQGTTPRIVSLTPTKLRKANDPVELAREEFTTTETGTSLFELGFTILGTATEKKVPIEEVRSVVDKMSKAALSYGSRWDKLTTLRIANMLAGQDGFAEVAVAQARRAERMIVDDTPASEQIEILETLAKALTKAGKVDDAKPYTIALAKLRVADVTEYYKSNLKFELPEFKGRTAKSDRVAIVEMFTTTTMEQVADFTLAYDGLVKTFQPKDVVFLQYLLSVGELGDPLSGPDNIDRIKAYNFRGIPSFVINGQQFNTRPEGSPAPPNAKTLYAAMRKQIEESLEKPATAKVAITITQDDKGYTAKATVPEIEKPGEKITLRFVLCEERVRFQAENNLRYHQNVVRAIPGGNKGVAVTKKGLEHTLTFSTAEIKEKNLKYLTDMTARMEFSKSERPMDLNRLKLIALVQDDATNEILNAIQVDVEAK